MLGFLGLLAGPLGGLVGQKAGSILSPLIMLVGAVLVWNMFTGHFKEIGRDEIRAEISEKVAEAKELEQERFFEREAIASASFRQAMIEVTAAREQAPQIIREIRNAPATVCSGEPIGPERVRLLNAAITGNRNEDPGAGARADSTRAALRDIRG